MPRLRATRLTAIASAGSRLDLSVFAGAAAAYSLRIPDGSTYAGPLVRVRRSSDNAEKDFYAVFSKDINGNRWLDTFALLAFCGSSSGYLTTWYDQSGNGKDVSNADINSQPIIVRNSQLSVTTTFKPTIEFPGGTTCLFNEATVTATQAHLVSEQASTVSNGFEYCAGNPGIYGNWSGLNRRSGYYDAVRQTNGFYSVPVDGLTTVYCDQATTTVSKMRRNGEDVQSLATGGLGFAPTRLEIGARNGALTYVGNISELILLANQTDTLRRSVIERNQGASFSVPVA